MARAVERRSGHPGARPLEDPGLGHSTFRDSAGETWTRDDGGTSKRKTRRLRIVLVLALLGAALTAGVKYRHQTTRFLDAASSIVSTRRKPAQVRMTFSSDPEGATVDRADGTLLGVTPLVTDVPYRDVATEYVFHKAGYLSKTVPFLRNTPSPLFVVLQSKAEAPSPPPVVPINEVPSVAVDEPSARKSPIPLLRSRHARVKAVVPTPRQAPAAPHPTAKEAGPDDAMDPTER